ncbi:MAG: squalene--hopene cyclase [Phycisphaerae bacterium]|nr:squalene--hopene cyclase [Phycisphaerae bacterium]
MGIDADILARTLERSRARLLSLRGADGCWRGRLSSSALSTATAAFALSRTGLGGPLVGRALAWLRANQNGDGGWGDTAVSPSNLSTTLLAWSALSVDEAGGGGAGGAEADATVSRAEAYIGRQAGSTRAGDIAKALTARYGDDRTFCVPILMMCALAGRLGEAGAADDARKTNPWSTIPSLPFEAAALPHAALRWLRLPVVSYAMPALIAVGQAVHRHRPSRNPLSRWVRSAVAERTLAKLRKIQPVSGGFLEAAPLTSFVMMALASTGQGGHPSVAAGGEFLANTVRDDGSWPIDTDLATWVTTLSINALSTDGGRGLAEWLSVADRAGMLRTLIVRQQRGRHPYTDAAPGGWAWTDLSGGVPDADDTAGALLAMAHLCTSLEAEADNTPDIAALIREAYAAADRGLAWLTGVQNRDGGVPTFCRGWGRLPFDRSSPDLTAHAARAMWAWGRMSTSRFGAEVRLRRFLERSQSPAGSWTPLWFGNELAEGGRNPVYGTARALPGFSPWMQGDGMGGLMTYGQLAPRCQAALDFLLAQQNDDGGWGACRGVSSSIEETAVAVEALCIPQDEWWMPDDAARAMAKNLPHLPAGPLLPAIERGMAWLIDRTDAGAVFDPAPIGLYFASLWYHEQIYPIAMTVAALTRAARVVGHR